MDDALLVSVLDGFANLDEKLESLLVIKKVFVTILGDWDTSNMLHHEIGTTLLGRSSIEDLGHVRVVQECEGLTFQLEACHDLSRIHAWLEDLQGNSAADRSLLLCEVDNPHSPFTKRLQYPVRSDVLRLPAERGERNG